MSLLVFSLAFNALLSASSIDRQREELAISRILVAAQLFQRDLEASVPAMGATAPSAWDRRHILLRARARVEEHLAVDWTGAEHAPSLGDGIEISLVLADGAVQWSTDVALIGHRIPDEETLKGVGRGGVASLPGDLRYGRTDDGYIVTVPVMSGNGDRIAVGLISLDRKVLWEYVVAPAADVVENLILALVSGALLLLLLMRWVVLGSWADSRKARRSETLVLAAALVVAQTMLLALTFQLARANYFETLDANLRSVIHEAGRAVEGALNGGAILDQSDIGSALRGFDTAFSEIRDVVLIPKGGPATDEIHQRNSHTPGDSTLRTELDLFLDSLLISPVPPVFESALVGAELDSGFISARISPDAVRARLVTMIADGATIALIVLLVCMELALLMLARMQLALWGAPEANSGERYKLMRPAIFLFLFGIDSSMAFMPLHMERFREPLFGLPKDVVMGLPISAEFLCVGIAILVSGIWLDRRGWREPFIFGVLLAAGGGLYSWLATDAVQFIASRAVVGLGYGLTLLAAQGFVIQFSDSRSRAQGLAHLFAGLYAGSICGAVAGAILAERFGYEAVFLSGSLLMFAVLVYVALVLGKCDARAPQAGGGASFRGRRFMAVSRFLIDRRVVAVVLFSSLPASIAAVGFLNYFSPVYLSRIGAPESMIGQVLMLFGICVALLGPRIGHYVDQSANKKTPIFLGGVLGGIAFLSFLGLEGVPAAAVAVLLLGISNSMVLCAQSAYLLKLEVTQSLGTGKAMALFRSSSRVGQMLGPVLFAWLILLTDIHDGVIFFGLAYLVAAVLFLVIAGNESSVIMEKTA